MEPIKFFLYIRKRKRYTSKLVNPISQAPSRPKGIDGVNAKASLVWVSLHSSVPCGFVLVFPKNVAQFLFIESNNSSVSFLRVNITILNWGQQNRPFFGSDGNSWVQSTP